MPTITKINSGKGLVSFTKEEIIDLDLAKWVRADSKGYGKRDFISVVPIEKQAAKVYKEKFPSVQVKLAEKCFLRHDGAVDVVLKVANDVSEGNYKTHPTKLTLLGDVHTKESAIEPTFDEVISKTPEKRDKKTSGLYFPIEFIEENISKFTDDEKRQVYAELGDEGSVEAFLSDMRSVLGQAALLAPIAAGVATVVGEKALDIATEPATTETPEAPKESRYKDLDTITKKYGVEQPPAQAQPLGQPSEGAKQSPEVPEIKRTDTGSVITEEMLD